MPPPRWRQASPFRPLTTTREALISGALASAGLTVGRRVPRGTVPGGEAENVHRGGGRYVSVIGSNGLFHHPDDRGVHTVDLSAIASFVSAFTERGAHVGCRGIDPAGLRPRHSATGQPARSHRRPCARQREPELLRGEYGRYRANNDLLHYDLDVRIDPDEEVDQRPQHRPLQDAQGRHAHPAGALCEPHDRSHRLQQARELKYTRDLNTVYIDFPGDAAIRAAPTPSTSTTPARRSRSGDSMRSPSRRTRPAATGSTPRTKASARACGGPARISGATSRRAWTSRSPCPNGLTNVSNGRFIDEDRSRRRLHQVALPRALPDQQLQRVAEHRQLRRTSARRWAT